KSTDVAKIGRDELRAYIRYLQEVERWANKPKNGKDRGKMSAYSVQGHVRGIKALFGWLADDRIIESNPLAGFPLPKVPQYVIKTLTPAQIKLLLSTIDKTTPLGFKYHCIILLLVDSGMRISELLNIKISDLDIQQGLVTIFGKGQKQRVVPVSRITMREILRYWDGVRQSNGYTDSPYLFPDTYGSPITVNSIQQYLRRLAQKAGLGDVKVTPHIFRHTAATHAAAQGTNAFLLKEILGHSSMQTTMRYVHPQPGDLKAQHNRFSLVNELFKKK
ncbi:MAG: tyrosine-type recombinase/integrase, partial [Candidatus Thorarchaeota archaeon]